MRKIRNSVKERNNKVFVPFSFESMMQLFGQNMDRDHLSGKIEDLRKILDKTVKTTVATKQEIDILVKEKMDSFVRMIESNNVNEADLSNTDNKLYQKLMDRSKTLIPGDDLNSPDAQYKYELLTSQFMKKNSKKGTIGVPKASSPSIDDSYLDGR